MFDKVKLKLTHSQLCAFYNYLKCIADIIPKRHDYASKLLIAVAKELSFKLFIKIQYHREKYTFSLSPVIALGVLNVYKNMPQPSDALEKVIMSEIATIIHQAYT